MVQAGELALRVALRARLLEGLRPQTGNQLRGRRFPEPLLARPILPGPESRRQGLEARTETVLSCGFHTLQEAEIPGRITSLFRKILGVASLFVESLEIAGQPQIEKRFQAALEPRVVDPNSHRCREGSGGA